MTARWNRILKRNSIIHPPCEAAYLPISANEVIKTCRRIRKRLDHFETISENRASDECATRKTKTKRK